MWPTKSLLLSLEFVHLGASTAPNPVAVRYVSPTRDTYRDHGIPAPSVSSGRLQTRALPYNCGIRNLRSACRPGNRIHKYARKELRLDSSEGEQEGCRCPRSHGGCCFVEMRREIRNTAGSWVERGWRDVRWAKDAGQQNCEGKRREERERDGVRQ